jgi:hypothetical protein
VVVVAVELARDRALLAADAAPVAAVGLHERLVGQLERLPVRGLPARWARLAALLAEALAVRVDVCAANAAGDALTGPETFHAAFSVALTAVIRWLHREEPVDLEDAVPVKTKPEHLPAQHEVTPQR